MPSMFDDYDELDDFDFNSFAATRRLMNEQQREEQRHAVRRHRKMFRNDAGDDLDFDYDEDEFDNYYPSVNDH